MNTLTKYAFFTMDLESFYDTSCIRKHNPDIQSEYHCYDGVINYLNILDKHNIKSTIFVVGTSLDDNLDVLKKAISNGHNIGIHNYRHESIINIDDKEFETNLLNSKKDIENKLDVQVLGYRAPIFRINNDKLKIVEKHFKYDSSALYNLNKINELKKFQKLNDNIYINNSFIEIPPTSFKKLNIGGGAFVRLTPWIIMKHRIKKYLKKHDTYLFYTHPFEFSNSKHPKITGLNPLERLFITLKIKSYPKKLEWLISYLKNSGFEFITIEDYIKKTTA